MSNYEVAKGYRVEERVIRDHKSNHKDELIENKHFVVVTQKNAKNFGIILPPKVRTKTFWTKRGVVRLGFFIKSERAKKFRDWAEDLILQKVENDFSQNLNLQKIRERAELLEISEKEFGVFERVFYKIGITRKEELAITSNRAVAKETGVDFIELAEKKGISTPEKYFTVTELCQKVMDSDKYSDEVKKLVSTKAGDKPRPQNLNKILESHGFQEKIDGIWKATEKAKYFSDFVQNKSQYSEKTVFHTVWKKEILKEIF
ncbi:ORF6N domain-containing protein [Thiovulum sp. ES]|nr:ORF6N domain-containing protein [Thiovulum sp. ES]